MANQPPALPWAVANGNPPPQQQREAEPLPEFRSLDAFQLSIGDRIEVKWVINNEDGTTAVKWWGAKIIAATSCSQSSVAYKIRYDAAEAEGFDEEDGVVAFSSERELLTIPAAAQAQADEQQEEEEEEEEEQAGLEVMVWRREGDSWDEDDEMAEGTISAGEYMQMVEQAARSEGVSVDEWGLDGLHKLPPAQQRVLAERFCSFGDQFRQFMAQARESGEMQDGVVTLDHVQRFLRRLG